MSVTLIAAIPFEVTQPSSTVPPRGVHRNALSRRLFTIWSTRSPSVMTVGAPSIGVVEVDVDGPRLLAERPGGLLEQRLEPHLLAHHPELVRLEAGQVEQVADEPVEPAHLLVHGLQRLVELVGADDALGDGLDVAGDGGERRAQLVGDAHQEVALELVDLAQAVDHPLEPGRQLAELVVGVALADHVHVEVAAGHLVGRAADHAQRAG